MSLPFLVAANPSVFVSPSPGLSLTQISYLSRVLVTPVASLTELQPVLKKHFGLLDIYADVTSFADIDDVVAALQAGVRKALVTPAQLQELNGIGGDRFIARITQAEDIASVAEWTATGSPADNREAVSFLAPGSLEADIKPSETSDVFIVKDSVDDALEHGNTSATTPVLPSTALSIDDKLVALLTSRATADATTSLYATTVMDERDTCLGLVYSSSTSILESLRTGTGVYQSRKRGLWYKGASSGDVQELVRLGWDCDADCLAFVVRQKGRGFCHTGTLSCFGEASGLTLLQRTLQARKASPPAGSYTARLFNDPKLVQAKIMEEAEELCTAETKEDIAFEAADVLYFTLTRCIAAGVSLEDVEKSLDLKSHSVKRRKGDAKKDWASKTGYQGDVKEEKQSEPKPAPRSEEEAAAEAFHARIHMPRVVASEVTPAAIEKSLQRPSQRSNDAIVSIVRPIIDDVRTNGDSAVLNYTRKFEKASSLTSPALKAPFHPDLMDIDPATKDAIDTSYANIEAFHAAQTEKETLAVETMPGVKCSRFSRPIERVGLYVPGGTAVLPSTALMLGVPAKVAGCSTIVLATPPLPDGTINPAIVYIAHKVGASCIVLAGGAQAIAALAYGTQSIPKVDKILGPGNQFVTAAKMLVSNDTSAIVSIDMPAGPSEVLVIADSSANPTFVASDLLSQAEHGVDSQVVLIAVGLSNQQLLAIEDSLNKQAHALPRVDIVRGSIAHSVTLCVDDLETAMQLSNLYAPEHLILQIADAKKSVKMVENAGSVFVGEWTPESVGDYSAGVNHSLPTYGYARQYSGVSLSSFMKHITASELTATGLRNVSQAVMRLASVEGLDAHRRAVVVRMGVMDGAEEGQVEGKDEIQPSS